MWWLIVIPKLASAQLTISIVNISESKGKVLIALYHSKADFLIESKVNHFAKVDVSTKKISYSFKDLPQGYYAISLFHDINNNEKLDTNFFGIPIEPYGFSNNAKARFGPPSYDEASFYYNGQSLSLAIKLKKAL
jgi:uncharacterized protein (DUF2141 family)